ncbi:MAG: glucosamine--fructose-6-phosphate aminotransferase (isomerizing) [Dasania sp.]|jgi:glucosamine--fructose-6-phosphate aminotransferase (isomerizing)
MCGIIGVLSQENGVNSILEGLKRLEYRGYDSSGIAVLGETKKIQRIRAQGKLANLVKVLDKTPLSSKIGIGHIRWATHGAPTQDNAHPHATDKVAIVHNGIIENYRALKIELESLGHRFTSETDSEVIAHLSTEYLKQTHNPEQAVFKTLERLEGAFAISFLFADHDDILFGARRGSPLAIGKGDTAFYLGSDAMALAPMTNKITYLDEGDWCILTPDACIIKNMHNEIVTREQKIVNLSSVIAEKEGYRHFMLKEIYEQPMAIAQTLSVFTNGHDDYLQAPKLGIDLGKIKAISIIACGTAYYAGYVAQYYFEKLTRIPVAIEIASEFRYRKPPLPENHLTIIISQSGETADSLAALRYVKSQGGKILSIVNTPESTIVRESDACIHTHAGPEIGVASTKAFTAQLATLISLSICMGHQKGLIDNQEAIEYKKLLLEVPRHINEAFLEDEHIQSVAHDLSKARDILYLGRGTLYPLALEGALKLKEISYIHAEGYPAGELKHGPIALIDEDVPVIVIAPSDELFEKTISNMQEVSARGGKIILISDKKGIAEYGADVWHTIEIPDIHPLITPFVASIPLQLLAYHTAVHKGTDVDQPRNLAKSVTVE